jgi:hypothetical protein
VPLGDWIGPIVLALMNLLALGPRPRRQLRLVHRRPHRPHQPDHGPPAALQHRQRHQDGQARARDARDPGSVPQGARPRPRRQEMQKEVAALYARHG